MRGCPTLRFADMRRDRLRSAPARRASSVLSRWETAASEFILGVYLQFSVSIDSRICRTAWEGLGSNTPKKSNDGRLNLECLGIHWGPCGRHLTPRLSL